MATEHEYFIKDTYSEVEAAYCEAMGYVNDFISTFKSISSRSDQSCSNTSASPSSSVIINQTRLPPINLQRFTGNYIEWPAFKDMFTSIIGNDATLTDCKRLQYLKMYLGGDAEQLLRNISVTEVNYASAWKILTDRYDNKRILINVLIKSLMSIPASLSESSTDLKRLLDGTVDTLKALENLGRPVNAWDDWIIYLTAQRLDPRTRIQWENSISNLDFDKVTFKSLKAFLENRIRALESIAAVSDRPITVKSKSSNPSTGHTKERKAHVVSSLRKCPLCSRKHIVLFCPTFRKSNIDQRRALIAKHKICYNCLSTEHFISACTNAKRCQICQAKHHTMLHKNTTFDAITPAESFSHSGGSGQSKASGLVHSDVQATGSVNSHIANHHSGKKTVLLATALITLRSHEGKTVRARALLDQGSDATLLAAPLLQKLKLNGRRVNIPISGVGSSSAGVARRIVSLELLSEVEPNFVLPFEALVLPNLTTVIPSKRINLTEWSHIKSLKLADPNYTNPGPIDIILGADVYASLLRDDVLPGPPGCPTAQRTAVGWILSGVVHEKETSSNSTQYQRLCYHNISNQDLNNQLASFWEIEEMPSSPKLTPDEEECIQFYDETTTRDGSGRYIVRLPLKSSGPRMLGNSRFGALKSLLRMEKQFASNPDLARNYSEFMKEYRQLDHMVEINRNQKFDSKMWPENVNLQCYIPHHAIVRDESVTTKLRVVFNASFKTSNGLALNDILQVGPKLQSDVLYIIIRWRKHMVAFSGDIEKMYRQILVQREDQDMQRILWRKNPNEIVEEYRLATVTYGMNCAPYLAIKTLHRLAQDEEHKFPLASVAIKHDTYVDDVLSGADSITEALELQHQLNAILKTAGFNLRKWSANRAELLENLEESQRLQSPWELSLDKGVKTLGLEWHPSSDEFVFRLNLEPGHLISTKRGVLSAIARLYDPMGWLSPVIISAKILMQNLWTAGLDWDAPLSGKLATDWGAFGKDLPNIQSLRIGRWIGHHSKQLFCELHGFSDSSEFAYAAAVYMRVGHDYGNVQVTLLAAKSRVAPLKRITIPRLELCGAVLLAKLIDYICQALNLPNVPIYTWTDSTTVLAWISSHPHRWKTFIANRVSEIQTILKGNPWRYVPTNQNPADCATRGLPASNLIKNSLWWHGPTWLSAPSTEWPKTNFSTNKSLLLDEEKTVKAHHTSSSAAATSWDLLNHFSSLRKLLRVTAYIQRFCRNSTIPRDQRLIGPLTPLEINNALKFWPSLDEDKLLRVGGRLNNSNLSFSEKHPVILPKDSFLTTLIVRDAHLTTHHGGEKDTCSYVQQKFWITGLRRIVRYMLYRCVICFKLQATAGSQIMAALPEERVVPSRPFLHSGVDYAGPISLRVSKGQGQKTYKGYIALFVCFSTKAVHLETVSDATAEAFIAAYKRFSARRGIPSTIFSDNATTFVGSNKELQRDAKNFYNQYHHDVAEALSVQGTHWRFIPASSPHFGGLWEANIKCVKYHLKRAVGDTILTYEEMSTILCQIESCLNSRPLCPLSSDPTACDVLTPGHFLVGSALNNIPEPTTMDTPINRLTRWELLQNVVEHFWYKWSRDYLHYLQQRAKWNVTTSEPKVDDIVLVRDRLPPSQWMIGRIVQLHPGADGRTRVVTLRSKQSYFKRPVVKICILPINDEYPVPPKATTTTTG